MTVSTPTDTPTTAQVAGDRTVTLTRDEFACLWGKVTQRRTSANRKYMEARQRIYDSRDVAGLIPLYMREVPIGQARETFARWDPIYQKLRAVAAHGHTVTLSSPECALLAGMVRNDIEGAMRDLSLRSRYSLDADDRDDAVIEHTQLETFVNTLLQKLGVQL